MTGMDAATGKELSGLGRLRQSIADILRTPLGSRVMRAEYGSRLHELVDAPLNAANIAEIYAAAAEALGRWEPLLTVKRIRARAAAPGRVEIAVEGEYDGRAVAVEGVRVG